MSIFDHARYVNEFLKMGIDCYMSKGTKEALSLKHHRINIVEEKKTFIIGTFSIMPFSTQHDAIEPLGFLIYSNHTGEKLLFATDTYYIKYRFTGLTHLMIECNFSEKTINPNCPYIGRLRKSHFSLENVVEFLKANDLSKVQEIHLLHLSDGNSDEKLFKETIQAETGKIVKIAG